MTQKQPMEYYRDVSIQISKIRYEFFKLLDMLGGHIPKGVYRKGVDKIDAGTMQLPSDLENRMYKEHPDIDPTYMFYGIADDLWKQFKNIDGAVAPYFKHPSWDYTKEEYDPLKMRKERLHKDV